MNSNMALDFLPTASRTLGIPESNGLPLTEYSANPSPPPEKLEVKDPFHSEQPNSHADGSTPEELLILPSDSLFTAKSGQYAASLLPKIMKSIASSQVPEAFLLPDGHPDVGEHIPQL